MPRWVLAEARWSIGRKPFPKAVETTDGLQDEAMNVAAALGDVCSATPLTQKGLATGNGKAQASGLRVGVSPSIRQATLL